MKSVFLLLLVVLSRLNVQGQMPAADSLRQLLETAPPDTNRVHLLMKIGESYYFYKPDTSKHFTGLALELARKLHYSKGIINALTRNGEASRLLGDYPASLKSQQEALELSKKYKNPIGEIASLCFIGVTYLELKEYRKALQFLLPSLAMIKKFPVVELEFFAGANAGITYDYMGMPDSALYYLRPIYQRINNVTHPQLQTYVPLSIGNVFSRSGNRDSALFYYNRALLISRQSNESINISKVQHKIAELYAAAGQVDSSLFYARQAFANAKRTNQRLWKLESSTLLVTIYRLRNNLDSAFYFEDIASAMKDSLYGPEKFKQLQLLMLDEQQRLQQEEQEESEFRNRVKYMALIIALAVLGLISFLLFRNSRMQQKAKKKIEIAYAELKDTQQQLVQREKMASLGELTAGIAHEIQNPLNFVNNFSEVNKELADELKQELASGNLQQAKEIAENIKSNEEKINFHGKRADSIVKGMLQHSRSGSGLKEPMDINNLVDECLRLSFHGMRAKDKSFNAKTEFIPDTTLPPVRIISQDIGRVLLNLFTNAFYSVMKKQKTAGEGFEPLVTVSTFRKAGKLYIAITDNGNGIPKSITDKIFQPFFTTKPAGEGTGLGLSMSYDIVTMGHGGELIVDSREGEFAKFTLTLPL